LVVFGDFGAFWLFPVVLVRLVVFGGFGVFWLFSVVLVRFGCRQA
jgi:hypothetical protein